MTSQNPRPKFKLGETVRDRDNPSMVGEVSYIGSYDDYLKQYRYKVLEPSGRRNYWNENSMIRVKTMSKAATKLKQQKNNVVVALAELHRISHETFPKSTSPEAHELELWQENTESLYRQQQSIELNLAKKIVSGKYDHTLSVKLWRYLADAAAQDYTRRHGSGHGSSFGIFTTASRDNLARRLAHDFAVRASARLRKETPQLSDQAEAVLEKVIRA